MKSFFSSCSRHFPLLILLTGLYLLFEKGGLALIITCLHPLLAAAACIYLLEPIVNFFSDTLRLPRLLSLLLTYLGFFAFLALLLLFLIPDLLQALSDLLGSLPALYAQLSLSAYLQPFLEKLPEFLGSLFDLLTSLSSLLSGLGSFFIALIMSFYFLLTHHSLGEATAASLYHLLPVAAAERSLLILSLLDRAFRAFISSKLLLSLIQAAAIFFSSMAANLLFRLSIPSPLFMGLLTFFANLIPFIGPLLGILLCSFLSFLYGLPEMIVTCCLLLLWQQIDNLFLSPHFLSSSSGLSPFWVLAVITAAASLGNLWLLLTAVPLTAFAQSLLRAWREGFSACSLPPKWLRYRP
ncbi:MAG: AI-2E family transporter [Lachnospiraceae bacterium]|jgi:predicted PurR-regulated permease PerM|nr:AI-2E family transporter [Lachnospiraceae bacterium]